eukprot:CAMPEP_0172560764 /NCGR_PEP_ID=MMETSP1067-20121228/90091_1 /TAXON_ID=265564 ORGANISM="Thalassiosira punctigera, Strain Tpunct2005C2" /NCGR_SAMPLE_ID=MMETSP1067 /ASSEMBLY_ACC=CAM_ASM_000444 /LENGTH=54 /DNA_ID=CAMNT_0013350631 /DNA_START=328 /DNA_END=489 /DNA_ORIENTATION=-
MPEKAHPLRRRTSAGKAPENTELFRTRSDSGVDGADNNGREAGSVPTPSRRRVP